jgi:hypothetical protein
MTAAHSTLVAPHARRTRSACRTLGLTSSCLALLALGLLGFAAGAPAAPAVTFKATALPIPGFPGTGNILGAGAEVEVKDTISGTEYGGFPSPLRQLTLTSPAGTKITPAGFVTCAPAVLENSGPAGCPKMSVAGPLGEGLGVVSFGGEQVQERVTIQPFFAPGGELLFYANGSTPVSLQITERAHLVSAPAGFGPEVVAEIPLVETVPGAPDASILSFTVTVGAAYRRHGKTVSYITVPKHCPRGGYLIKSQLSFFSGEHTVVDYHGPCPRRG